MNQKESRKNFLKRCVYTIPSFLGMGLMLIGCNTKNTKEPGKNNHSAEPCSDLSEISEKDIETRKKFNYVESAAEKKKSCDQCNLYIPPESSDSCGGCMLIKGPVYPKGTCTYWAPKIEKAG
ncbi:MAG: hypothetical protein KDF60_20215 [Calditrichaeota bacterium]|nr:hypothetical protein [Calditrichota bacterium]